MTDRLFHTLNRVLCVPPLLAERATGQPAGRLRTGEAGRHVVYLTFDDGPASTHTREIMSVLSEFGARASFFVTTSRAAAQADTLRDMLDEGHTVESHGHTHDDPWRVTRAAVLADLARSIEVLHDLGIRPSWHRPAYGHVRPSVVRYAKRERLRIAGWDVMPGDFRRSATPTRVARSAIRSIRDGSIVVLHDNDAVAKTGVTLAALTDVLAYFSTRDWEFRSLPTS